MKDPIEEFAMHLAEPEGAGYLPRRKLNPLTRREREVLEVIAEGHCSKEAGERLFISKRTVDYHLAAAYQKLGANNRVQAIRIATRHGLIPTTEGDD